MWALAVVLLIAGFGLLLIEWGHEVAGRAFRDLIEAFDVDIAAGDDDELQDDDG